LHSRLPALHRYLLKQSEYCLHYAGLPEQFRCAIQERV